MTDTPEEWTQEQNALFVRVYRFMSFNQKAVKHPGCAEMTADHWQTICHNAAWMAAELLASDDYTVIDLETDEVLASSEKIVTH